MFPDYENFIYKNFNFYQGEKEIIIIIRISLYYPASFFLSFENSLDKISKSKVFVAFVGMTKVPSNDVPKSFGRLKEERERKELEGEREKREKRTIRNRRMSMSLGE